MTHSDHELMLRYQRGDESAFAILVDRWQPPLLRLVCRLNGFPQSEAEDALQEVFLRVARAAAGYQANWAFSTWVYTIALNAARDMLRKQRPATADAELEPETTEPTPPQRASRAEAVAIMREALMALKAEHREPLVLKHFSGLTFQQIAAVLQTPESTVKSRTAAALHQLRRELKNRGISPEDFLP